MASWLLGFLASWLLGFLAFRLLGFSASGLLVFSAFGFSHPLHSQFLFGRCRFGFAAFRFRWLMRLLAALAFRILRAFWLLRPSIGFWIWLPASSASPPPYLNHHFFAHHGGEPPRKREDHTLCVIQAGSSFESIVGVNSNCCIFGAGFP